MDQPTQQPTTPQPKILLVEDDLFLRELYHDVLTSEKFAVETAEDGESAFAKIHEGGWDLILLDIILPKIDGLAIMRKIKNEPPKSPNKTVIFLTNLDKDEEIRAAMQLGDGYLIKSQITPGVLIEEVKKYIK